MYTSSQIAALTAYISNLFNSGRVGIGITALITYEYLITFGDEVNLFWMRKKTGASWLFFTVRYLAIIYYAILVTISYAPMSDESCNLLQKAAFPIEIVQYVFWAAFSGLRVLALTGMNWFLGTGVFLLASALFVMCAWETSLGVSGANALIVGCAGGPDGVTKQQDLIIVAVSRCCVIAADIIVIIVTWRYSVKNGVTVGVRGAPPSHLAKVLVVNGTVYFLVLLVFNAIQLISLISLFKPLYNVIVFFNFVDPLTAILICRLMLSLQSAHQRSIDGHELSTIPVTDGDGRGGSGTLRFASAIVGSLTEPTFSTGTDTISLDTYEDGDWYREDGVSADVEGTEKDEALAVASMGEPQLEAGMHASTGPAEQSWIRPVTSDGR